MPTKKEEMAHVKLKDKLDRIPAGLNFYYGVKYSYPTCLKCDGILSKASDSAHLICLKCEAKYELKEQVK
ncbi:hypothetical protein MUO83_07405 [Candidatus Bathyarchaeota archaeon]|nr:hypothetical protein [Candidatus Bathyarchaeota archaeon]